MLPVIALVGRPNVGKSTLFNVLTRTRDALVADLPGLTRDRKYGYGKVGAIPYLVVDTGGLVVDAQGVEELMAQQTLRAIEEADRVLFLVDAREGLHAFGSLHRADAAQARQARHRRRQQGRRPRRRRPPLPTSISSAWASRRRFPRRTAMAFGR